MATTHEVTIDKYEELIRQLKDELAAKFPKPKWKKDDIVMADGFRKVKILKVIVKDEKHWFSKHIYTFAYEVENVLTQTVIRKINGVSHVCNFSKSLYIAKEEDLEDIPENYETYLCHIIYNLTHKEIKYDN